MGPLERDAMVMGDGNSHSTFTPLLKKRETGGGGFVASGSRWWVMAMFTGVAIAQGVSWNVFSPVSKALKLAYFQDKSDTFVDSFVSWSANIANIVFLVLLLSTSRAFARHGARKVMLFSASMVVLCCALRLVPAGSESVRVVLFYASMVVNGAGGCW